MSEQLASEEIQMIAFTIILHSGNAKTEIHQAFKSMRASDFNKAQQQLENANEEVLKAHQSQTELLQTYARGTKVEMEMIMVHAQDHLMNTMTLREIALEMVHLYQQNHQLMHALNKN